MKTLPLKSIFHKAVYKAFKIRYRSVALDCRMYLAQILFESHLDPGEKILEVCHRHPFVMFNDLLHVLFFTFFVPLFLWYLFPGFAIFYYLWFAIGFMRLSYVLSNWYHDAILITNVSLIKATWHGVFDRTSTRLEYQMIEGLTYTIRGLRKTIFNYGDLEISRTGGGTAIALPDAANPQKVERLVLHYQEKFVSDQSLKDAESLKNLLAVMLRQHAKKHGAGLLKKNDE